MNRKLLWIGIVCLITFFVVDFTEAQNTRPIVRLIYFLPKDRQPQPDIDAQFDKWIKEVQQFYANQMEAHGFGRKTFQFETDASGNAVVHHFVGQFTDEHYSNLSQTSVSLSLVKHFELRKNFYFFTAIDISTEILNRRGVCGVGSSSKDDSGGSVVGGKALIPASGRCFTMETAAHELGHAFGLAHDFRGGPYIMSYNSWKLQLSKCAAEWLNAHPAFNPERQREPNVRPQFIMHPPRPAAPPNNIRLRFEINDPNGIHQVQLRGKIIGGGPSLLDCKSLNGSISETVEFVTNDLSPEARWVKLRTIDVLGNLSLSQLFSIDITSVIPAPKAISIPDPHLAAAVQRQIGNTLTTHSMLNLVET